jgi:hypothetical protein
VSRSWASREANAPVFDYCTDVLHAPEWNPKLLRNRETDGGSDRVATRFRMHFDGVGWSTTENVAFHRPSFWAATSASRRLDVRFEGEVMPTERGARLVVRTLLLPHGVLRLAKPFSDGSCGSSGNTTYGRSKRNLSCLGKRRNALPLPHGSPSAVRAVVRFDRQTGGYARLGLSPRLSHGLAHCASTGLAR